MKKLFVFAVLLMLCNAAWAQWENIAFISAYRGFAFPLGNMKATSINNSKSGYAKQGSTIGIDGGYVIDHWGIVAKVAEYQYDYNTDALNKNYLTQNRHYNLSNGIWVNAMYAVGGCGVIPVTDYFCIRGNVFVGLQNSVAPGIRDLDHNIQLIDKNTTWGFYKGASLALQFRIGHFSIAPEASIESSQARMNDYYNKTVKVPVNAACVMGALVFYLGELNSLHENSNEFSE
jgi:hypothetical protein